MHQTAQTILLAAILAACLALLALFGREALAAPPKPQPVAMKPYCSVGISGARCSFTNDSPTPAAPICPHVQLIANKGGATLDQGEICSGVVPPQTTVTIEAPTRGDVTSVCHNDQGDFDWGGCTLSVK